MAAARKRKTPTGTKTNRKRSTAARGGKKRGGGKAGFAVLLLCIAAAACIGIAVRLYGLTLIYVRSDCMEPSIGRGSVVLVSRLMQPERGDIVLYGDFPQAMLGRMMAEEGDTVSLDAEGRLTLNGAVLNEPYTVGTAGWTLEKTQMGDDTALVLPDSRGYGGELTPAERIGGVVIAVLWPLTEIGFY